MGFSSAGGLEALIARISSRVGLFNAACGALVSGLLALHDRSMAVGFLAGSAIGVLNVYWLMKIAKRGVGMRPEKAGRFVMMAYPVRFALVAALFALFIVKGKLSPWPLVAGFAVSIATTIAAVIYFAREESSRCTTR